MNDIDIADNILINLVNVHHSQSLKCTCCNTCYFYLNEYCMANQMQLSGNTAACSDYIDKSLDLTDKQIIRGPNGNMQIIETIPERLIYTDEHVPQIKPGVKATILDVIASDDNIVK